MMGVQNTKGHCAGNGGLRGHSCGPLFPCVIYAKGLFESLTYWVIQPNGVHAGPHATWDDAEATARSYNDAGNYPAQPIASLEMRKVQLNEDEQGGTNCESWAMAEEVPFDCYGLYAVDPDGYSFHLCDRDTYPAIRDAYAQCTAAFNALSTVGERTVDYRHLLRIVS